MTLRTCPNCTKTGFPVWKCRAVCDARLTDLLSAHNGRREPTGVDCVRLLFSLFADAQTVRGAEETDRKVFETMNLNIQPDRQAIKANIEAKLARQFGCTAEEATRDQMYKATAITVKEILMEKRSRFSKRVNKAGAKRVY